MIQEVKQTKEELVKTKKVVLNIKKTTQSKINILSEQLSKLQGKDTKKGTKGKGKGKKKDKKKEEGDDDEEELVLDEEEEEEEEEVTDPEYI